MTTPQPPADGSGKPTPDDLAGVPVCAEGKEDVSIRPRRVTCPRPADSPHAAPTPDYLGGIPVCAEAAEDLTIRPRRRPSTESGEHLEPPRETSLS